MTAAASLVEERMELREWTIDHRRYVKFADNGEMVVDSVLLHNATVASLRAALAAGDEALAWVQAYKNRGKSVLPEVLALTEQLTAARAALNKIAAWDDYAGNGALEKTGSYGMFDEPSSVKIARDTLSGLAGSEGKVKTDV